MSDEILINVTPHETRVALLENGVLQELQIERTRRRGLVGNIYQGRVQRVLPGMQAAFIDAGLERTAFLHASDIAKSAYDGDHGDEHATVPDIRELLHEGQEILVQVLKDPLGSKGARLTTRISIPSRFLVYLPAGDNIGLSTRIEDAAERARLLECLGAFVSPGTVGGYIVRTAGEGAQPEALRADMLFLNKLWDAIRARAGGARPGELVHADLPLAVRVLRDQSDSEVPVRIDSAEACARAREFAAMFVPHMAPYIEQYTGERSIFELYGIEDEIQKALERKVLLKSGGYLILDQTEAMTTIDVNTGAYVGHRNPEETVLKTNLEAAQAIARQLRLRNLGGIIILDFIDMHEEEHKQLVLQALAQALAKDHAKTQISAVSSLGLVEMTRKRSRESLEHVLCMTCPTCGGRASLKTPETVCYEIFREVLRVLRQFNVQELRILAAPAVVDLLLDEESAGLAELESQTGKPIRLQAEALYVQEQFDVVPM